jgi:tripartite-type tricarboxylate transporter receptor subunit TctC
MTRLPRRQFLRLAASAAAVPAVTKIAHAQPYPSRPITVIVPTGAGGPQDVIARVVTDHMRGTLGQAVFIENVPGANGTLGIGRLARAKPDGYTLAFSVSSATHVFNPAFYALPYNVIDDFEPVGMVTKDPGLVVIAKRIMPANDLKELIAWMRANPGKGSLGHTGVGSPGHVASILFQKRTSTSIQDVPYRNAGQAMQDVIAGHLDMMFTSPSIALAPMKSGSIKAYAVMARDRLAAAPEIPTVDEAGLPDFYIAGWHAYWAPKGTSHDVIARLHGAILNALADSTVRKRIIDLGLLVVPRERQTPGALAALQRAEIGKWLPLLKEAGINPISPATD